MEYFSFRKQSHQKGAAALIMVVVLGVAALLMAVGAARLGMGEIQGSYTAQKGDEALYLADGCVEDSLERLRTDAGYSGGTVSMESGTCVVTVVANGNLRTVTVTATVDVFNKRIQAIAALSGTTVTLSSWNEVHL